MIDREWLEALQFRKSDGSRVHGIHAIGGESVILRATRSDGQELALKVRKHHLGFHIRELPLFLTDGVSHYSVDRLNSKLLGLLGNPLLDGISSDFDRLHSSIINLLEKYGVMGVQLASAVDGSGFEIRGVSSDEAIHFLLGTPGIKRRLGDWASLSEDYQHRAEGILSVNGPNFPFTKTRRELIGWARKTLAEIDALDPILEPSLLADNPLYVWGAAVTDGFFTDDELPVAVDFLNKHFGPLRKHSNAVIFLEQARAIAHLLGYFLQNSAAPRFAQFCGMLGFRFQMTRPRWKKDDDGEEKMETLGIEFVGSRSLQQDEGDTQGRKIDAKRFARRSRAEVLVSLGKALANTHLFASHGDVHLGNFGFEDDTNRIVIYDCSRSKILKRPLTCDERVEDLLSLRLHSNVADWSAFCTGYGEVASAEAAEVFARIEARMASL